MNNDRRKALRKLAEEASRLIEVADQISIAQRQTETWVYRAGRWDMGEATRLADGATKLTGERHIAIDNGPHCYPRYDVVRAPAVGDEVSYSFNGDTYPDGKIVRVSASLMKVTTDTGSNYYRRGITGRWVKQGGTWSMVRGHRFEQNPCF